MSSTEHEEEVTDNSQFQLSNELSMHVFTTSAALAGVCLTVISLIQITKKLKNLTTIGDDLLAANATIFVTACIFSYASIRTNYRKKRLKDNLEKVADFLLLTGLTIIALVCVIITYTLAI